MLYKAKHYLSKRSLLVLYYSFIHTYINYGNMAWESTNRTSLKKIMPARSYFEKVKFLNVFQLNILKNFVFMHKIKSQTAPKIFQNMFWKPTHKYPTIFFTSNYSIPPFKSSKFKYRTSIRSPHYGRTFLQTLRKCRKE